MLIFWRSLKLSTQIQWYFNIIIIIIIIAISAELSCSFQVIISAFLCPWCYLWPGDAVADLLIPLLVPWGQDWSGALRLTSNIAQQFYNFSRIRLVWAKFSRIYSSGHPDIPIYTLRQFCHHKKWRFCVLFMQKTKILLKSGRREKKVWGKYFPAFHSSELCI